MATEGWVDILGRLHGLCSQVALAREMRQQLPPAAQEMMDKPEWNGGRLIYLESETVRPSFADLKWNACWIHPICKHSPTKAWPWGIACMFRWIGRVMFRNASLQLKFMRCQHDCRCRRRIS